MEYIMTKVISSNKVTRGKNKNKFKTLWDDNIITYEDKELGVEHTKLTMDDLPSSDTKPLVKEESAVTEPIEAKTEPLDPSMVLINRFLDVISRANQNNAFQILLSFKSELLKQKQRYENEN